MRPFRRGRFALTIAIVAVLLAGHPGVRGRASFLRAKWTGAVNLPWSEVAVRLAPHSWQPEVRSWIGPWTRPWIRTLADADFRNDWKVLFFEGPTPALAKLNCHYSTLQSGVTAHAMLTHRDEEILVPIRGALEIVRGPSPDAPDPRVETIQPGQIYYLASEDPHTTRSPGPQPSSYLVVLWDSGKASALADTQPALPTQPIDLEPHWESLSADSAPSAKRVVLDQPTRLLGKLHVHLTRLGPGGLSPEHIDRHDTLLLIVEGVVETLGQRIGAETVVFLPAHQPHSIRNAGAGQARYLVLEFHRDERAGAGAR